MPLTPKQQEIATKLVNVHDDAEWDPASGQLYRDTLESALGGVVSRLGKGERLFASKWDLHQVHACEGGYMASKQEDFEWSPQKLRGKLFHRSMERFMLSSNPPPPVEIVEASLTYFKLPDDNGKGPRDFLLSLSPEQLHDLVRDGNDALAKFIMDWPPLDRRLAPRVEMPLRVDLLDRRIVLKARVDLAFGLAGAGSRCVRLVEFKTGDFYPDHLDDLRFYALLETLVRGLPPLRIALYYPDSGECICEDVTPQMLTETIGWVIKGLEKISRADHLPFDSLELNVNPSCRWCPASVYCPAFQQESSSRGPRLGT